VAIRSESERRRAEEQVEYLQSELEKIPASEQEDEVTAGVMNGLHMHISDIENELAEYDRLKKGLEPVLTADSFDDIGELVINARIARGWSQADLAEALDMQQQQVQRYERNNWEKISLWRLQEVVEALGLDVAIHARLHDHESQNIELPRVMSGYGGSYPGVISSLGSDIGETLGGFGVGVGEALGNTSVIFGEALGSVSMDIGGALGALTTTISDVVYGGKRAIPGAAYGTPQTARSDTQMVLEGDYWDAIGGTPVLHLAPRRATKATTQQRIGAPAVTPWQKSEAV
jgi:transcriptional regulator with XRE-family HTH domain